MPRFFNRLGDASRGLSTAMYHAMVEAWSTVVGTDLQQAPQPIVAPLSPTALQTAELSDIEEQDVQDVLLPDPLDRDEEIFDAPHQVRVLQNDVVIDSYASEIDLNLDANLEDVIAEAQNMMDQHYLNEEQLAHFKIHYRYIGMARTESTRYVTGKDATMENVERLINHLAEKYEHVLLRTLILEIIRLNLPAIMVRGSKYAESTINLPEPDKVLRVDSDWVIYSPKSETNCFYQAVVMCMNPENIGRDKVTLKSGSRSATQIVSQAVDLKRRSGCFNLTTTREDMEKVSNRIQVTIRVLNAQRVLIQELGHYKKKFITVITHKNHCYAYIPFKEQIKFGVPKPGTQPKRILMKVFKTDRNRDTEFYAADLESFTNKKKDSVAYAIGHAHYDDAGELKYESFTGHTDCIDKFFASLFSTKKNKTVYFHNGGKYDINVLIQQFLLDNDTYEIDNQKKIYINGRYSKFVVKFKNQQIIFLDSVCLWNMSLEAATGEKGFNVEHQKLVGAIDHTKVNINNYQDIMTNGMSVDGEPAISGDKYMFNDIVGLLECLDKFGTDVWESFQINITKVISASSIAKRIFKSSYLNIKDHPIVMLDDTNDSFVRQTYHGGRTESFKIGKIEGPIYYYDFTSLYPSVAAVGDCGLPYGPIHNISGNVIRPGDLMNHGMIDFLTRRCAFICCQVKTVDYKRKPLHGLKYNGKLVFAHFSEWTELYLIGAEIIEGIKSNLYEYKFIEGKWFTKAPILQDYFKSLFDKKQQATADSLEALAIVYKITANSGYGFWALNTDERPDTDIIDAKDYDGFLHRILEGFDDVYDSGTKIVFNYKKSIKGCEKHIAIGSQIAGLSRLKLWKLMDRIEQKGGFIIYGDTDSVFTTYKIEDDRELMEEFMWDGCGKALGALKNEVKDAVRKCCLKNGIPLQPMDHIKYAYFAGLKVYRYVIEFEYQGKTYTIDDAKLKGFKQKGVFTKKRHNVRKLEDCDYEKLLAGGRIVQKVDQFTSNKKAKVQSWQQIKKITKRFRFTYNKGVVQTDNIIRPFIFPQDKDLKPAIMMDEECDIEEVDTDSDTDSE